MKGNKVVMIQGLRGYTIDHELRSQERRLVLAKMGRATFLRSDVQMSETRDCGHYFFSILIQNFLSVVHFVLLKLDAVHLLYRRMLLMLSCD